MAEPGRPSTKCDNCAGTMTWDAAAGLLKCRSCGATRATQDRAEIVEHDLEHGLARSKQRGRLGAGTKQLKCQECGAVVEFPDGLTATHCSFCDSPQVLPSEARDDLLVPESLVPFSIGRDKAVEGFNGWLAKLWFRPSDLKDKADVHELRGVYVPYWTFDTQVSSNWTADAGYHYYVEEPYTDNQGQRQTRRVQHTRWEPASGRREDRYEDHLVCASKGVPDGLAHKVGVFDTRALVGYAADYLQGFSAESYALDLNGGWERARREIGATQESRCRSDVPGDTNRNLRANHRFSGTTFKHVLLPLWIAAFRYNDKVYRFLVNGQTGKVSGEAPRSWLKILLFVAAIAAAIGLIVFLIVRRSA